MEQIYKLQPDRTMHLQGFDGYGCTAALWGASGDGFTVSGVWGQQDDFVVLVLWDADCFFEHPRFKYLPDFDFSGITLSYTETRPGCVPMDSTLYPWIDWAYLNILGADGVERQVRLLDYAAAVGGYTDATVQFELQGTPTTGDYIELAWLDQHFNYQLVGTDTLETALGFLAATIMANQARGSVRAVASGTMIVLTYDNAPGANGNRIGVYGTVHGAGTEGWTPAASSFGGGVSPGQWTITLPFDSLVDTAGAAVPTTIQKMWLTLAPEIQGGGGFARSEFAFVVTDWTVTDANGTRALQVAGPGSVRMEDYDRWVGRSGFWEAAPANWWSQGSAIRAAAAGAKLTIETHCQSVHDIYVGTLLDVNCGIVSASLDGGAAVTLDCYGSGIVTRRLLFAGVAAGAHSVGITLTGNKNASSGGWYFYFDFLECAVRSDVPDAAVVMSDVSAAIDYDTDHGYKLSPQRLMNLFDKLGFAGPMNEYVGVFWWPQRTLYGSTYAAGTIVFGGQPEFGKVTSITLAETAITHLNLIGDTAASIATCFALLVNQGSTAVWAEANGAVLTLTARAWGPNYELALACATNSTQFNAAVTPLTGGVPGTWGVDPAANVIMNRAAIDWHVDFYAEVAKRGMAVTSSLSMELVNPPGAWAALFGDGTAVTTATGFGTLNSTQCAPGMAAFLAYQTAAFQILAELQAAAGLTPSLQFGEFLWWYFAGPGTSGMAYYDAETVAAATLELGRPLAAFLTPNDDPGVNGYADAQFLRARLRDHAQAIRAAVQVAFPGTVFEALYPYDVNYPRVYGPNKLGGRLNHYVNTPPEWMNPGAGFLEGMKTEALDFASGTRSLDLCAEAIRLAVGWGWPVARVGYLVALFNGGCPWQYDLALGRTAQVPAVILWALDHVCLFGWAPWEELAPGVESM